VQRTQPAPWILTKKFLVPREIHAMPVWPDARRHARRNLESEHSVIFCVRWSSLACSCAPTGTVATKPRLLFIVHRKNVDATFKTVRCRGRQGRDHASLWISFGCPLRQKITDRLGTKWGLAAANVGRDVASRGDEAPFVKEWNGEKGPLAAGQS